MNRRMFLKAVPVIGVLGITSSSFSEDANTTNDVDIAPGADGVIKLNPPDLNRGISLMQALKKKKNDSGYVG